jgi:hypothetical protein
MLRALVIGAGIVCLALGAGLVGIAGPAGWMLLLAGLALTLGTIFEQHLYKPVAGGAPPKGWVDTGERVVDEKSGETVAVYSDPRSGERVYVRVK